MDVQSPSHLERLRDQPEVKVALLRFPGSGGNEVRFERSPKNTLYRDAIQPLADRFAAAGAVTGLREDALIYGRPCWLLAASLGPSSQSPAFIAVVAADGAPPEDLLALLQSVSHDYWYGSSFFK